jgi:hypothetical protein
MTLPPSSNPRAGGWFFFFLDPVDPPDLRTTREPVTGGEAPEGGIRILYAAAQMDL